MKTSTIKLLRYRQHGKWNQKTKPWKIRGTQISGDSNCLYHRKILPINLPFLWPAVPPKFYSANSIIQSAWSLEIYLFFFSCKTNDTHKQLSNLFPAKLPQWLISVEFFKTTLVVLMENNFKKHPKERRVWPDNWQSHHTIWKQKYKTQWKWFKTDLEYKNSVSKSKPYMGGGFTKRWRNGSRVTVGFFSPF